MKYKVLIKGLGNEINEDYRDLNSDQINKFLDSDNIAYAVSHLKNGKLEYTLVTKKFWNNKEKFSELSQNIMFDQSLSEEQKNKEISKLLLDLS